MRQDKDAAEIQAALDAKKKTEVHLDQIRGSLFGGAVGDACGTSCFNMYSWREFL